jgi:hypothetical protein
MENSSPRTHHIVEEPRASSARRLADYAGLWRVVDRPVGHPKFADAGVELMRKSRKASTVLSGATQNAAQFPKTSTIFEGRG